MRVADGLLLLFTAVGCHAGVITIRTQSLPQTSAFPGSSFFITSQSSGMPLETMQMDLEGNPQAFSSVFTDRRSGFFDTRLSTWLDQQIAALDQLQAVLDQAPRAKMPCPRMAAAQRASKPDMLAYMASSRFGPALLSSLAEQAAQDAMDAEALDAVDMDDVSTGSLADWSSEGFGADGSGGGFISVSGYADEFPRDGRGFEPSMLAEEDAYPIYSPYVETEAVPVELLPTEEETVGPSWFFVFDDGSLNWGLIVFLGLLLAVVPLWCHVIQAAARLSCCARRRQARVQEQFLASATQPLLGNAFLQPLAPEKPMAKRPCPVEVASEHVPKGGNDYVTIAYVPLKGEQ